MSGRADVSACQARLAVIWLLGGGLVFVVVLAQSLMGKYGEQTGAAWSWLLPALLPTVSMIVGAIAYDAARKRPEMTVERLAFRIAAGLSVFYLLLLILTLLVEPLTQSSPLELLEMSKLWLGPVQGLVGLSLGAFFVSREG